MLSLSLGIGSRCETKLGRVVLAEFDLSQRGRCNVMGLFMRDLISLDELFTGRPLVGLPESFEKRIEAFHSVGVGNWICAYTCYIGTATKEYSSPSVQVLRV